MGSILKQGNWGQTYKIHFTFEKESAKKGVI
jgi:hypothetical protein